MPSSDFAQAREPLEQAWLRLSGDDEESVKAREALDLLIEAVAHAEYANRCHQAEIIEFRRTRR